MQRRSKPLAWRAKGLSDTEDASNTFSGAMASLQNLIPDPSTAKLWYCRPAATVAISLESVNETLITSTATLTGAPNMWSDFAAGNYWYNGAVYSTFSAWLTAVSGTFSRSSSAYYTNSSGVLTSAANNVLRFDYDPVALTAKGILLEGASTNIAFQSQSWTNGQWSMTGGTASANAATAPDGNSTATLFTENTSNSLHGFDIAGTVPTTVANTVYTLSLYVKPGTRGYINLNLISEGTTGNFIAAVFDLTSTSNTAATQTGVGASSGTIVSTLQQMLANGWFRVSLTGSINETDAGARVMLAPAATGNTINSNFGGIVYTGTSETMYLWGVQEEALSFASSYIPTTSSTATRAADALEIPWTATAGTFLEAITDQEGIAAATTANLGTDQGDWLVNTRSSTIIAIDTTAVLSATVANALGKNTVGISGNSSSRNISVNGAAAISDTNGFFSATPSKLELGLSSSGVPAYMDVAQFGAWTSVATSAQLQILTSSPTLAPEPPWLPTFGGASAQNVLNFGSVPASIVAGLTVSDTTNPNSIQSGTTILSTTSTTITLSKNVAYTGVQNGDTISFVNALATNFLNVFGSTLFSNTGFISTIILVGDTVYGMIAGGNGYDLPFAYDLATSTLILPTGVTTSNAPASPATTGAWTPPTQAVIGSKMIVTHPGFSGAGGAYFGVLNILNPAAPTWTAQNLTGGFISFVTVPSAVAQFFNRAYFITNASQPAVIFSDILNPTNCTNANQILTFGDTVPLTAVVGLPLNNQLGGIVQSLMVFKGVTNIFQITGDLALNNLSTNSLDIATGTMSPESVCPTPKGLAFIAPDGLRLINFTAQVSDPIGFDGSGITLPFSSSIVPSRVTASCNGSLYRVTTQNGSLPGTPTYEYWYDFSRQIWSGPHTCTMNQIQPWRGTFIGCPTWATAALYESDPIQNTTSSFTENGAALTFDWNTPLLPDTDEITNNAMTEGSLDVAFGPSGSVTISVLDQNDTIIDTITASSSGSPTIWGAFNWRGAVWGGATNNLAPQQLAWHFPIVFTRMSIDVSGISAQAIRIGALHMRYQMLKTYVNNAAAA
jgi:hypothetical protein